MTTDDDETAEMLAGKDYALAKALARGRTYTQAGAEVGWSTSTVWRKMQTPRFRAAVDQYREVTADLLLHRNLIEAERSMYYLSTVRDDPDAADYLRVRASSELLMSVARLGRFAPGKMNQELTPDEANQILMDRARQFRDEIDGGSGCDETA